MPYDENVSVLVPIADALERIARALEDGLALAAHIHVAGEHEHAPPEEGE